jgi:hypothetical protein
MDARDSFGADESQIRAMAELSRLNPEWVADGERREITYGSGYGAVLQTDGRWIALQQGSALTDGRGAYRRFISPRAAIEAMGFRLA